LTGAINGRAVPAVMLGTASDLISKRMLARVPAPTATPAAPAGVVSGLPGILIFFHWLRALAWLPVE